MLESIERGIAGARQQLDSAAPVPVASQVSARVSGQILLDPSLAERVTPNDTVFLFARVANGPPMPLAARRISAKDLPFRYVLDESMAMAAEHSLAQARAPVVVVARVSRSGDVTPRSGDLEGMSKPVAIGLADVVVTIDGVRP